MNLVILVVFGIKYILGINIIFGMNYFLDSEKNLCDVISVAIGLGVKERALTEWSGLLLWLLWGEGVEVGILFGGIEAGTELTDVGEVAVTADFGFRVTLLQIL